MWVFLSPRGFTAIRDERGGGCAGVTRQVHHRQSVHRKRERDLRNGFTIPPKFSPLDILAMAGKLPWLLRMRRDLPRVTFANYARPGETADLAAIAEKMGAMLDPALSWREVDWLRGLWKGPFLLKGILHPAEAAEALKHGVDGLIVSNHGGRQLDGAIASLDALPTVVAAVEGRMPVLLDGGIRRGSDVVKALALGAAACLIARPQLFGLAVAGETGVARVSTSSAGRSTAPWA
jgi:L-lactate dehydrogenase (cytochrome)/(S)-mandelate dehydrogenase